MNMDEQKWFQKNVSKPTGYLAVVESMVFRHPVSATGFDSDHSGKANTLEKIARFFAEFEGPSLSQILKCVFFSSFFHS